MAGLRICAAHALVAAAAVLFDLLCPFLPPPVAQLFASCSRASSSQASSRSQYTPRLHRHFNQLLRRPGGVGFHMGGVRSHQPSPPAPVSAQNDSAPFSKMPKDGLYHYYSGAGYTDPIAVDLKGNTYTFKGIGMMGDFAHGIAPAVSTAVKKWGYVNFAGEWIAKPIFDSADEFVRYYKKDGTSFLAGSCKYEGKSGFILSDGSFHYDSEEWHDDEINMSRAMALR